MSPLHALVPAYLAACLILGGASAAGFLSNMLLQLAAIPILFGALLIRRQSPISAAGGALMALLVLFLCLFASQLVPLPAGLWSALPGREAVAEGFRTLGTPLPWLPISLEPFRTFYSLIWLLPAVAVLLGILRWGAFRPSWLAWTILAVVVLGVAVGAIQVAGGARSAAYFYETTNRGFAVGFFANSNHMATLLLIAMPFVAATLALALGRRRRSGGKASGTLVLAATIAIVLVVGLAINTSLAGIALAVPTAGASFLLVRSRKKPVPKWIFPVILVVAAGAIAAVLSSPMGNNLTTAEAKTSNTSRYTTISRTLEAARDYFPVGSGIGTFVPIYRTLENPSEVTTEYVNHAHSDFAEIILEAGLPGVVLFLLFFWWWLRRSAAIWSAADPDLFARAATIATAAVMVHSTVDYPLRTAAISALFAACLALMAEPRPKVRRGELARESGARHLSAEDDDD